MIWTLPFKILYSIVISLIFVAPAIVGYALHLQITRQSVWALGVYGAVVFCFVILQLIFATLNRCMVNYYHKKQPDPISSYYTTPMVKLEQQQGKENNAHKKKSRSSSPPRRKASKLGLAVVGYREEPGLFAACLESIQRLNYPDPITLVVVIDGDQPEDREMATVFQKCFPNQEVITLPHLIADLFTDDNNKSNLSSFLPHHQLQQQANFNNNNTYQNHSISSTYQPSHNNNKNKNNKIHPYDDNINEKIDISEPDQKKYQHHYPSTTEQKLFQQSSFTLNMNESIEEEYDRFLKQYTVMPSIKSTVCYMQPHRGKRHAMYTAFRILLAAGCESIVTTDSDTKFDSRAIIELEKSLHWFPNIGAAAGDVRIWNTNDSLLSFMSSLRYWMAFNIERAAQGFNRAVTCVSGPMGIYRGSVLRLILNDWVTQQFMGMECTYGDDRHLTNRVLTLGKKVVYNHLAYCETETPIHFLRWFKQQTRWSKSFYREILWNIRSLHKHSPWMAAELFYQGMYPFVLMFSIFYILWNRNTWILLMWLVSLMLIALIKTIYSVIVARSFRFLAFPLYSVYYLFGLVPAKLWALVSLWDVGWGTSARSASERKRENVLWLKIKESIPPIIWIVVITAGVLFNIIVFLLDPINGPYARQPPDPTSIVFYPNPY
ncbi:nucleotide-diphospho-sugar transferase [Cunninghamella echinulata]|nr:nucleotide-diphospho-sugar transferase [Cunninghamella echinulata]